MLRAVVFGCGLLYLVVVGWVLLVICLIVCFVLVALFVLVFVVYVFILIKFVLNWWLSCLLDGFGFVVVKCVLWVLV